MNTAKLVTEDARGISWHDWQERNRFQDSRGVALRAMLTKCAAIAVLLLALPFWSYTAEYRVLLSFAVCTAAVRVAFLEAAVRRYVWASLFAGMALLYNPVFALFTLTGRVALFVVISSIAMFALSSFLAKRRLAPSVADC